MSHRACRNCGTYAGRQVLKMKSLVAKKAKPEAKAKK